MSVQNAIEIVGDPTALYRLYGDNDVLLYIGITRNIPVRFAKHEPEKAWWPLVTRKTMVWYGSRSEAEAAEMKAIGAEHPLCNIVGQPREEDLAVPTASPHYRSPLSMWASEAVLSGSGKASDYYPLIPARYARRSLGGHSCRHVALYLEGRIWSGELAPGAELPPEAELQAKYNTDPVTIRMAVVLLRKRGLVIIRADGAACVRKGGPATANYPVAGSWHRA